MRIERNVKLVGVPMKLLRTALGDGQMFLIQVLFEVKDASAGSDTEVLAFSRDDMMTLRESIDRLLDKERELRESN